MEKKTRLISTKQLTTTGILLAICIVSQYFKNLSIFITGPIINACIVMAVLTVNLPCAIILSIITPITAYILAASPVMMAVPAILVFIMLGNIVLAVTVFFLLKKDLTLPKKAAFNPLNMVKAVLCALAKGVFMGLTISLWLLPTFIPAESPLRGKMHVFQTTFSLYQFITACIGFIYVFLISYALRGKMTEAEN